MIASGEILSQRSWVKAVRAGVVLKGYRVWRAPSVAQCGTAAMMVLFPIIQPVQLGKIFSFAAGAIRDALGTTKFDEAAIMLNRRVEAAGFVDVREYVSKAPVGDWHPGASVFDSDKVIKGPRMNRIGRSLALGWLGFLEAMRSYMLPLYNSSARVDDVIIQVRDDYCNPNYHGYFMYLGMRKESTIAIV